MTVRRTAAYRDHRRLAQKSPARRSGLGTVTSDSDIWADGQTRLNCPDKRVCRIPIRPSYSAEKGYACRFSRLSTRCENSVASVGKRHVNCQLSAISRAAGFNGAKASCSAHTMVLRMPTVAGPQFGYDLLCRAARLFQLSRRKRDRPHPGVSAPAVTLTNLGKVLHRLHLR